MRGRLVRKRRIVCTVGAIVGIAYTPVTHAQDATPPGMVVSAIRQLSESDQVWARLVTVKLNDVSLKSALKTIAQNAGVEIIYRNDLVAAAPAPVSIDMQGASLDAVLARVLKETGLHAVMSTPGVIAIKALASEARQVNGVIVGKVISAKTRQPVMGVNVTVNDSIARAVSGSDGAFRVSVAPGEYMLRLRAVGFVRQTKTVTVSGEGTTTIEVALEPSASVLDEVVVTGTVVATERRALANPITVITAEEIQRRGVTRIEQFLRGEVPGVVVLDEGSQAYYGGENTRPALGKMTTSYVYSRGSSGFGSNEQTSTSLKTYVDGVELLDPSYLGTIDPNIIERIEIITGPQAATVYGSGAMGGVMQIFTKRGTGASVPDITATLRVGILQNSVSSGLTPAHNDVITIAGGNGPSFNYTATASYNYTGQWVPALFSRRSGGSVGGVYSQGNLSASGSVGLTTTKNGTSSGSGLLSSPVYIRLKQTGEWSVANIASSFSSRVSNSSSQNLALNVDYRIGARWQHHVTLGRNQTRLALIPNAPQFSSPADTLFGAAGSTGNRNTWGYNTTLQQSMGSALSSSVTLGFTGTNGYKETYSGCLATPSATDYMGCSSSTLLNMAKSLGMSSWGAFGTWQTGFFSKVFATVSLRAETNPTYGREHRIDWTPNIGLTYTMEMGEITTKFLASYGRATRPPAPGLRETQWSEIEPAFTPSQYLYQIENPALAPEVSHGPQGGFEIYWGNRLTFTLNRYDQKVDDLILGVVTDSVQRQWSGINYPIEHVRQWRNAAAIRQHGWETTGSLNLWRFGVKGSYSMMDSRVLSIFDQGPFCTFTGSGGCRLEIVPGSGFSRASHTGSVTVSYTMASTSASFVTTYMGQQQNTGIAPFYYSNQSQRLDMYSDWQGGSFSNWTLPGYAKSDLSVSQRLNRSVSVLLNIVNLGNSFTSDTRNLYPTLGRQTTIGVSLRFP